MDRFTGAGRVAAGLLVALVGLAACAGADASAPPGPTNASAPTVAPPTARATETAAPAATDPAASPAAITMTTEGDTCRYDGPASIPYGAYEVSFIVGDSASAQFGWFVLTLGPGRTVQDARAALEAMWADADGAPPDWITLLTIHPFETTGEAKVARENLRQMGAYTGGPIYFLCARPDRILGLFGPIEVVQ